MTATEVDWRLDSGLVILERRPGALARALAGAVAGFTATLPMTLVMVGLHRLLPPAEKQPLPPRQITERLLEEGALRDDVKEDQLAGLTIASHFAYGGAAGSALGLATPFLPRPLALSGAAFGLIVWADSYLGWLPISGIMPISTAIRAPARTALMLAAHVVWGAVTGLLASFFLNPRREPIRHGS
jgi:hypothetical protein